MSKLANLLRQFSNNLSRGLDRQGNPLVGDSERLYTDHEAKDLFNVDAPEGYLLRVQPDGTLSYVTPTQHEISADKIIDPAGKSWSFEEFDAAELQKQEVTPEQANLVDQYQTQEIQLNQEQAAADFQRKVNSPLMTQTFMQQDAQIQGNEYNRISKIFGTVFPQKDVLDIVNYAAADPDRFVTDIRRFGDSQTSRALLKTMFNEITPEQMDTIFNPPAVKFKNIEEYFKASGWDTRVPEMGTNPKEDALRVEEFQRRMAEAQVVLRAQEESWWNKPLVSQDTIDQNAFLKVLNFISPELIKNGKTETLLSLTPTEILNSAELQMVFMGAAGASTAASSIVRGLDAAANIAFGAGQIGSTYANKGSLSGLELAMGYGMGALGLVGGAAQLKGALPRNIPVRRSLVELTGAARSKATEILADETGALGKKTPDGELPIGTEVIDYGNGAERFKIARYEMDQDGNWIAIGIKDGKEIELTKDIDPAPVEKPSEMAPGTSVQTGLPGMGPDAAQSKMFEESNTAAGQGGKAQGLIDADALKRQQSSKPLEGQPELPTAKAKPSEISSSAGARKATKEGTARVKAAQQQLRDIINDPDLVGKQRADAIANHRELINFLSANADTRKPLKTDYFKGDQIAYTGVKTPEGYDEFIYLEGAKAGVYGVRPATKITPSVETGANAQKQTGLPETPEYEYDPHHRGFRIYNEGEDLKTGDRVTLKVNINMNKKPVGVGDGDFLEFDKTQDSMVTFKNPLVLSKDWETELKAKFKSTSKAREAGYDGIVSMDGKKIGDVINLGGEKGGGWAYYTSIKQTTPPKKLPDMSPEDVAHLKYYLDHIEEMNRREIPLNNETVQELKQLAKTNNIPESVIDHVEDAFNHNDIDELLFAGQDYPALEEWTRKLIDEIENPPEITLPNTDIEWAPDVTNVEAHVEAKYINLPDIDGATEWTDKVDEFKAEPQELDDYLSKLKPEEAQEEIELIEATIGDMAGELSSTYRYESMAEGLQIEKYMDSILEVTQKYREKLGLEKTFVNKGLFTDHASKTLIDKQGYDIPVEEINVDPARFQFKGNVDAKSGATNKLEGANWNPTLGGVTYGWEDKNGKVWIVNGHHRLDLAKRSGAKTIRMIIEREADGVTEQQARTNGALINIAEDQGTALDVAKFLKDSGQGIEYLKQFGITAKGKLAGRGAALASLDEALFKKVINGQIDEDTAVAIGEGLPGDFTNQLEVAKIASSQNLNPKQLSALIKEAKWAGTTKTSQMTLFGETVEEKSLLLARAKLRASIEDILAKDRRLFGYVTGKGRPEALQKGGTKVDVAKGQELAQNSATAQVIFEAKVNAVGPINDIINDAAEKLVKGGKFDDIKEEALNRIREAITDEGTGGPARPQNPVVGKGTEQQKVQKAEVIPSDKMSQNVPPVAKPPVTESKPPVNVTNPPITESKPAETVIETPETVTPTNKQSSLFPEPNPGIGKVYKENNAPSPEDAARMQAYIDKTTKQAAQTADSLTRQAKLIPDAQPPIIGQVTPEQAAEGFKQMNSNPQPAIVGQGTQEEIEQGWKDLQNQLNTGTTRPEKIGRKEIITPLTENKIQTLNLSLQKQGRITPQTLARLQEYLDLPTDRYISDSLYITESQGKALLRALNQEADIGLEETAAKVADELQTKPELKGAIDDLNKRMYSGAGKKVRGNPLIDFGREMYRIQKKTKSQIGDLWRLVYDRNLENGVVLSNMDKELEGVTPAFGKISKDKKALERINNYIASKNHWSEVPYPADITAEEIKIAKKIENQFMSFQNDVRFYRVYNAYYEFDGDPVMMATRIKDAPIEDLRLAGFIYEIRGLDGLKEFLKKKTWGIIESGYEPHIIVNPKLQLHKIKANVIGKGRLQSREGIDFLDSEKNILQRREAYIKQLLSMSLEPYFRAIDREYQRITPQLANPSAIASGIELAIRELRGYHPTEIGTKIIMKAQGYAFSTLALSPHMSFRNVLQTLLQPNVQSLIKVASRRFTSVEQKFFDTFISQETGITKDYLMQEGMGTDRMSRFVQKLSYYGKVETVINRTATFKSSLIKARSALEEYANSGDVNKFISHSGLTELPIEDQKVILETLSLKKVDLGLGMEVEGYQAAIMQLARKITEKTHFIYQRAGRARIEMGNSGRTLFSLFTYPRNTVARMVDDLIKIKNGTAVERLNTARNLTSFIAACFAADFIYQKVTGKNQAAYNPLTVLTYQGGGLAIGVYQDITDTINQMYAVATGDKTARSKLIISANTLGDMFIPFYKSSMDILEAASDQTHIDREALQWLRSNFDQKYKFNPHANDVERQWFEGLQHALFGGGDIPLTTEQTIQQKIDSLGKSTGPTPELSIEPPEIYSMKDLYSDLSGKTPDELQTSEIGIDRTKVGENKTQMESFPNTKLYNINSDSAQGDTYSELYKQWQARSQITDQDKLKEFDKQYPDASKGNLTRRQLDLLEQYSTSDNKPQFLKDHPELKEDPQTEWLKNHPEENARLAIWGQAKILSKAAYNKAVQMMKDLDIPDKSVNLPPADVVNQYFDYEDAVAKYSASSAEAQLIRAENPQLEKYLNLDRTDKNLEALKIQVKNRDLNDEYDGYSDKESTWYRPSIDKNDPNYQQGREYAREQLLLKNPGYKDDLNKVEALTHKATEQQVKDWVEYSNIENDAKRDLYMSEHPELYRWAIENKLTQDDGGLQDADPLIGKGRNSTVWNLNVIKIKSQDQYIKLDKQYKDLQTDDERKAFKESNPTYRDDTRRIKAFNDGANEAIVSQFLEYSKIVDQYSSGSAEAKLYRVDHPDFTKWGESTLRKEEAWSPVEGVPTLRINAQYRKEDEAYNAIQNNDERVQAQAREQYLEKNPEYRKARYEREGYQMGLADAAKYVSYSLLPEYGAYRKRFILENPDFFQSVTAAQKAKQISVWSTPDPGKVPSAQYDELFEKWRPVYEALESINKEPGTDIERAAKRDSILKSHPEFVKDDLKRDAYGLKLDKYVEDYANYYSLSSSGYSQERYLQSHPEFYQALKKKKEWKDIDFEKVPSEAVENLLTIYDKLPTTNKQREAFRRAHPDLDQWLVDVNHLKPLDHVHRQDTASQVIIKKEKEKQVATRIRSLLK
jgi:hypothetical protein